MLCYQGEGSLLLEMASLVKLGLFQVAVETTLTLGAHEQACEQAVYLLRYPGAAELGACWY